MRQVEAIVELLRKLHSYLPYKTQDKLAQAPCVEISSTSAAARYVRKLLAFPHASTPLISQKQVKSELDLLFTLRSFRVTPITNFTPALQLITRARTRVVYSRG